MKKRLNKKRASGVNKNITERKGLLIDIDKWSELYLEHVSKQYELEMLSKNTKKSYEFLVRALGEYVAREYDIKEGIETINEDFVNDFLHWVSQYRFNIRFGSDDYIHDTIVNFYEWLTKHKEKDLLEAVNNYIRVYKARDIESVSEILVEFVSNFVAQNSLKASSISSVFNDKEVDLFIVYLKDRWKKILSKASKGTMMQRKASILGFLSFISDANTDKHDFRTFYRHINSYLKKKGATTTELKRKKGYSDEEEMRIVDNALRQHIELKRANKKQKKQFRCALRDALLGLVMMYGGLRASEAIALTFDDFHEDGEQYIVEVKKGKGGKSRNTMIYKPLIANYLEELYSMRYSEYLAATTGKNNVSYFALYNTIKNIVEKTGLKYNGLHSFRHTFASKVAACGDIAIVAELLGHSDFKTTQIYITINDDRKKDAVYNIQKTIDMGG